jgi:rRNA-processing protein FCF1
MPEEETDSNAAFTENSVFPDAASAFTFKLPNLQQVKSDCIVILDTNVLLVPYTTTPKTLDEISLTFRKLVRESRLVIPGHVAREFAKNRAVKLGELFQQLTSKKAAAQIIETGQYPLLENIKEYSDAIKLEKKIDDLIEKYHLSMNYLLNKVKSWRLDDPVSLLYNTLFNEEVVIECDMDDSQLIADYERRCKLKIPPGYKDSAKESNAAGDLIIWHTLLRVGRDRKKPVLLVSGDMKADWWHKSCGQALYPRYELIDEFRRASNGNALFLVTLSDCLSLFGANKEVIAEVRKEETIGLIPIGSHRLSSEYRLKCERSILEWLKRTYPEAQILYRDSVVNIDYVVLHADGRRTAIDIMPIVSKSITVAAHHLIRRLNLINRAVVQGSFTDIQMFAVTDRLDILSELCNELISFSIQGDSQEIKLGVLEENEFSLIQTMRIPGTTNKTMITDGFQ